MKLSERFEIWYGGGEKGLITLCERDDIPDIVKDAARHWYEQGRVRFNDLVGEVKELEK